MALRNSLRSKIWSSIESSPFTVADFDVKFGELDSELLLVSFRHRKEMFFTVSIDYKSNIEVREAPGKHRDLEFYNLNSFDDVPGRLLLWTRSIRDELRAVVPIYDELDELRKTLDDHVAQHMQGPDKPFTASEAEDLKRRLDELSARFEQMEENNELTAQEVRRLNQEIASLKANVDNYPKGTWVKTAVSKLMVTVRNVVTSPEGRKILTQAAQKAIGVDGATS